MILCLPYIYDFWNKLTFNFSEEEAEMDSENESAWEMRMQEMEQNLEKTREQLAGRDVEDEETRKLVQQMLERC